jgi:hypothetical protein
VRWQFYGGLAGEPALGPVAFPHRLSAMPNPIAPIGHHWLDATHITFGVVTTGVFTRAGRRSVAVQLAAKPDENRWDLDLARSIRFPDVSPSRRPPRSCCRCRPVTFTTRKPERAPCRGPMSTV